MGMVTAGVSGWYGKTIDYARADDKVFPRNRVAVDAQLFLDLLPIGGTALKGEYMWGHTTIGCGNLGAGGNLPGAHLERPGPDRLRLVPHRPAERGPWNQLAVRYEQYRPDHTVDSRPPHRRQGPGGAAGRAAPLRRRQHEALRRLVPPHERREGRDGPGDPKAD